MLLKKLNCSPYKDSRPCVESCYLTNRESLIYTSVIFVLLLSRNKVEFGRRYPRSGYIVFRELVGAVARAQKSSCVKATIRGKDGLLLYNWILKRSLVSDTLCGQRRVQFKP